MPRTKISVMPQTPTDAVEIGRVSTAKTVRGSQQFLTPAQDSDDPFKYYCSESKMYNVMKPMLISMRTFGLYFERDPTEDEWEALADATEERDRGKSRRRRVPPLMFYSLVVVVIFWVNFARTFTGIALEDHFGPNLFIRFLVIAWTGLCTMNGTAMFMASMNISAGFTGYFVRWRRFQYAMYGDCDVHYAQRHILMFTGSCWLFVFLQTLVVGWGLYHMPLVHLIMAPFPVDHPQINLFRALYLIVHIYLCGAWTFPVAMHFFLCIVMHKELRKCVKSFGKAIDRNRNLTSDVEPYRDWHHRLCKLVENVDHIVSLMTGTILVSGLLNFCLILYNLIYYPEYKEDMIKLIANIFWLGTTVSKLVIVGVGGVIVNAGAHDAFELVHGLNLKGISQDRAFQLSIFLNRLSGASIGLTALKLFVIDKPTILTIVGMMITYFVLMVQFSPADESAGVANCTQLLLNATLQCYAGV